MYKKYVLTGIVLTAFLSYGTAGADESPAATQAAAAVPAAPAAPSSTPSAADQQATIIFFRPSHFAGGAVGYIVREGTAELGKLRNGTYFVAHVAPGAHQYVVHSEAKDILSMEVEAGQTYYVIGSITVGFLAGRPNIAPSDAAAFEAVKDKLKESAPLSKAAAGQ
jgi:Protein of unknown function (DUF2846)